MQCCCVIKGHRNSLLIILIILLHSLKILRYRQFSTLYLSHVHCSYTSAVTLTDIFVRGFNFQHIVWSNSVFIFLSWFCLLFLCRQIHKDWRWSSVVPRVWCEHWPVLGKPILCLSDWVVCVLWSIGYRLLTGGFCHLYQKLFYTSYK